MRFLFLFTVLLSLACANLAPQGKFIDTVRGTWLLIGARSTTAGTLYAADNDGYVNVNKISLMSSTANGAAMTKVFLTFDDAVANVYTDEFQLIDGKKNRIPRQKSMFELRGTEIWAHQGANMVGLVKWEMFILNPNSMYLRNGQGDILQFKKSSQEEMDLEAAAVGFSFTSEPVEKTAAASVYSRSLNYDGGTNYLDNHVICKSQGQTGILISVPETGNNNGKISLSVPDWSPAAVKAQSSTKASAQYDDEMGSMHLVVSADACSISTTRYFNKISVSMACPQAKAAYNGSDPAAVNVSANFVCQLSP